MKSVGDVLVDRSIGRAHFACDLARCKGACCTMKGGQGAPVTDDELKHLQDAESRALPFLSERNRRVIQEYGSVEGAPGDLTTRCIDDRDCVFVYYERDIAKCALERAWLDGESEFRKPLSCHLFPIRVDELFGGPRLRLERISECDPAVERGERLSIPLVEFLREPIIRAFGEEFYEELRTGSR